MKIGMSYFSGSLPHACSDSRRGATALAPNAPERSKYADDSLGKWMASFPFCHESVARIQFLRNLWIMPINPHNFFVLSMP